MLFSPPHLTFERKQARMCLKTIMWHIRQLPPLLLNPACWLQPMTLCVRFFTLYYLVCNLCGHFSSSPASGCCDHPSHGHRAQFVSSSLQRNGPSHPTDEPSVSGHYRHRKSQLLPPQTYLLLCATVWVFTRVCCKTSHLISQQRLQLLLRWSHSKNHMTTSTENVLVLFEIHLWCALTLGQEQAVFYCLKFKAKIKYCQVVF